jgi:apolipoprotein N-acyltransferase
VKSRPLPTLLIAGLLSATGFAPLDWWPVLLICFAVLLAQTYNAPSLRSALLRGWVFGVGHFTVGNNWIQHAFDYQDKMPPVLGYFAVIALALYLAIYPALAMGLAWLFSKRVANRAGWLPEPDLGFVLAAAAAWIVTEWLRGWAFTGYPWNPLGVAWVPTPVAGIAAWIGTYALSGVTLFVAGLLMLAARRNYLPLAIGAPVLALLSVLTLDFPQTPAGNVPPPPMVRVVQPNIGQDGVNEPGYNERVLSKLIWWSGASRGTPRLIVWPEGMVNDLVEDGYPQPYYRVHPAAIRAQIASVLAPGDMALIGGNALFFDKSNNRLTGAGNSIWPIDPDGMLGQRYDKAHLVPYGEYLPMRELLAPLGLARLVMGDVDFVPGPGPRTIDVPGFGKAGMQICYEIVFSGHVADPAHRPDFIFNPSNDAWFGAWGPPQHLAQARMRAIEEGLPILRATPTGISAIIDAHGRIEGFVPAGQEGAAEAPLPRPLPPTLFSRFGNWLAFAAAAILLLLAVANRRLAR